VRNMNFMQNRNFSPDRFPHWDTPTYYQQAKGWGRGGEKIYVNDVDRSSGRSRGVVVGRR